MASCIDRETIETALVVFVNYGQATKGGRWMPWHREAMKDVASCDKPRGAAKQALIRGFPNGATHLE